MLEGYLFYINSVAFSPDGKQVVSGSSDNTVRLRDAVTGAALQMLKSHLDLITLIAFSPNGKQVIFRFYNKIIRLWDAVTKAAL